MLRDVQDAAGHADPRTTRRYDRARYNLDRHPTYALATIVPQLLSSLHIRESREFPGSLSARLQPVSR